MYRYGFGCHSDGSIPVLFYLLLSILDITQEKWGHVHTFAWLLLVLLKTFSQSPLPTQTLIKTQPKLNLLQGTTTSLH